MMTTETTELLTALWGADPRPPVLPDPWERRDDPSESERINRAALRNRPDLGWATAERIAGSRLSYPLLKHREYCWIRAAKNLHDSCVIAAKHFGDVEGADRAWKTCRPHRAFIIRI